jgi:hypothetical protein
VRAVEALRVNNMATRPGRTRRGHDDRVRPTSLAWEFALIFAAVGAVFIVAYLLVREMLSS